MIEELLVPCQATVRDLMQRLDKGGLRTVFVTAADGSLCGVVTDGDLRRALLAGASLTDEAGAVMNTSFVSLPADSRREDIEACLSNRIAVIPLLDDQGRPVEVATYNRRHYIPAAEPVFEGNEAAYVLDCVESGWISSQGSYIRRFEEMFADWSGASAAVAVSNGTVALHLALLALGIGPGDEVIVPDLTFAASLNSVIHAGATPVIVDILPDTLTIDPQAVEAAITGRTRAIMPVHLYGQMCHMDILTDIADRHGLLLVEDAAEALGSRDRGRHAGTCGEAGTFSFFGNKLITTGEGGMVVFNDPTLAARARMLRDHGMDPGRRYWHQEVGYNYRMTNMQAAVGVAQMERIDSLLASKLRLAEGYRHGLSHLSSLLELPQSRPDTLHSYWNFPLLLRQAASYEQRDAFLDRLRAAGVEVRPLFFPLHEMPPYRQVRRPGDCPVSARVARSGFTLPSSPRVTAAEVDYICNIISSELDRASWHDMADTGSGAGPDIGPVAGAGTGAGEPS